MSDTHYALMIEGLGCYARGTHEECSKVQDMLRRVKSGARKETSLSTKQMSIQVQQGPYPDPNAKMPSLGYVPSSQVKK